MKSITISDSCYSYVKRLSNDQSVPMSVILNRLINNHIKVNNNDMIINQDEMEV